MKKRIISLLLIATMSMSLIVGCGNKEVAENTETQSEIETNIETESESVTELETEISTEIETPVETTEQEETVTTETTTPTYTYADMSQTMYAKQSVNVRTLPSTDGEKLGSLSYAQEVKVTGQCVETQWYRIEYNGSVGYVSNNYLVAEKPAEQTTQNNNNGGGSTSGRYGGYWDYVGDDYIYTGATLYTNTTYGTSFTIPSTSTVYRDDHPNVCNNPEKLTYCYPAGTDIVLSLCFAQVGNTETEALEVWRTTPEWTCSDIYTINIGGNTYYCLEATFFNGYTTKLMLARQTGGKVIIYYLTSNSTKMTVDIAKQYILY